MLRQFTKNVKDAWVLLCAKGPLTLVRRILRRVGDIVMWRSKDLIGHISKENPKAIKVAVYGTWDIVEALSYLTPKSSGTWGPVYFRRASAIHNPDFHLVLNAPLQNHLDRFAPPERIWFAAGEPRAGLKNLNRAISGVSA
jgi:hypothetical protein